MRALLLDYPDDPKAVEAEDEFLLGDDLLVAPVLKDGEVKRSVYLPKGEWYDFSSPRRYTGLAQIDVDAPLDRIPLFAGGGAVIPTQQVVEYTDQAPIDPLTLEVYPAGDSSCDYYEDDGLTYGYQQDNSLQQTIRVQDEREGMTVKISALRGSYQPPPRTLEIKIHGEQCAPPRVESAGNALVQVETLEKLNQVDAAWYFDGASATVVVKSPDSGKGVSVLIEKQYRSAHSGACTTDAGLMKIISLISTTVHP
jgi:alpha-glucosidase